MPKLLQQVRQERRRRHLELRQMRIPLRRWRISTLDQNRAGLHADQLNTETPSAHNPITVNPRRLKTLKSRGLTESADAEIRIKATEKLVNILGGALIPEAERPSSARSSVTMEIEGQMLIIQVRASDIAALRAALNSYLRWAGAVIDVVERVR